MSRFLPPSKVINATVEKSIIGDGCTVDSGSKVLHSVVGLRSKIGKDCIIEDSLLMGADYTNSQESVRYSVTVCQLELEEVHTSRVPLWTRMQESEDSAVSSMSTMYRKPCEKKRAT
eukprot:jgi/Picre1/33263/NNA_008587.t1